MDLIDIIFGKVKRGNKEMDLADLRRSICNFRVDTNEASNIISEFERRGKLEITRRKCRLLALGYGLGIMGVGFIYGLKLLFL